MVRTVWALVQGTRRLYLVDDTCAFLEPVKRLISRASLPIHWRATVGISSITSPSWKRHTWIGALLLLMTCCVSLSGCVTPIASYRCTRFT